MAIPTPDPETLLPPLFACLPTSFVSPRPPPALLPLLSPILRQRFQYSGLTSEHDGWLPLLSWDSRIATKLAERVEVLHLEPHPVSGELEVEHTGRTAYRRLDEETLQVRFELEQYDLLPIYVWCETDTQEGGGDPGWKLAELRALEDKEESLSWRNSIAEADGAVLTNGHTNGYTNGLSTAQATSQEDDDDDYWASYDRTPGRTPGGPSPNPAQQTARRPAHQDTDDDYYARYGSVQPAMDNHDPDEAPAAEQAGSTLDHPPSPHASQQDISAPSISHQPQEDRPVQRSLYPASKPQDSATATNEPSPTAVHAPQPIAPRPISPAASTSSRESVEKLERSARVSADMTRAETGVKQFIGSEVRGLFRLARSVGMEVEEFREVVERELSIVGMLEDA